MATPSHALSPLRDAVAALRAQRLGVQAFASAMREPGLVLDALPANYRTVWHNLLDRLESSALFSEESCSFSQTDLIDSLALWLDKAQAQLDRPAP